MISSTNRIEYRHEQQFRSLALLTVITIYLVILAGGIVRGTGSGMGCPDWPKCFGQWVPPTDVAQLPPNYQEVYSHRGYGDTLFNPVKTWIEYVNRLLGVLTGFFIFLTFLSSLRFLKTDRITTVLSFAAFISVGFQGWLGSKVVSSLLSPWMVTLHMLVAILIVGVLLYVTTRSYSTLLANNSLTNRVVISRFLVISTIILLAQILLGTQVREEVDHVAHRLGETGRGQWVDNLGIKFAIHRSFSWIVVITQLLWYWRFRRSKTQGIILVLGNGAVVLTVVQILTGITLAYLGMPAIAQPIHLTIAIVALGIQFVLILLLNKESLFPTQEGRLSSGKTVRTI
ncbi:MAG: COX15/CtaA family protein [Rudanella sp.]|nr:COX15/CtaA family protein [Rudanella sp.]